MLSYIYNLLRSIQVFRQPDVVTKDRPTLYHPSIFPETGLVVEFNYRDIVGNYVDTDWLYGPYKYEDGVLKKDDPYAYPVYQFNVTGDTVNLIQFEQLEVFEDYDAAYARAMELIG